MLMPKADLSGWLFYRIAINSNSLYNDYGGAYA